MSTYHGQIEIGNIVHESQIEELKKLGYVTGVALIGEYPTNQDRPTASALVTVAEIPHQEALDELNEEMADIAYVANIRIAPSDQDLATTGWHFIA